MSQMITRSKKQISSSSNEFHVFEYEFREERNKMYKDDNISYLKRKELKDALIKCKCSELSYIVDCIDRAVVNNACEVLRYRGVDRFLEILRVEQVPYKCEDFVKLCFPKKDWIIVEDNSDYYPGDSQFFAIWIHETKPVDYFIPEKWEFLTGADKAPHKYRIYYKRKSGEKHYGRLSVKVLIPETKESIDELLDRLMYDYY